MRVCQFRHLGRWVRTKIRPLKISLQLSIVKEMTRHSRFIFRFVHIWDAGTRQCPADIQCFPATQCSCITKVPIADTCWSVGIVWATDTGITCMVCFRIIDNNATNTCVAEPNTVTDCQVGVTCAPRSMCAPALIFLRSRCFVTWVPLTNLTAGKYLIMNRIVLFWTAPRSG